ncbi:MAG: glycosyltransferase [Cyanobacteria bacterium P01_A01_bin.114]
MPLISVVIPAYNSARTIGDTVQSVLAQTFTDFEIIVINDGSQDDTLERLSAIADPRLRVFSYDNAGVAISRNRGIEKAKGEYVAFLDADDLWVPEKLHDQYQALRENPTAALAYSWTEYIDDSGAFFRPGMRPSFRGDVYRRLLVSNFLECGSNPLVRRSALQKVGGFDADLPPSEDWEMWLRLARRYDFALVESPQILYRVSTSSASFDLKKHERSKLKAIEKAFADVPPSLALLKRRCISNFYRYLTFKMLDTSVSTMSNRQRAMLAARYWLTSISHEPTLMRQPRVVLSTLARIFKLMMQPEPPRLAPADV